MDYSFRLASSSEDFEMAKILFQDYAKSIAYHMCFESFEQELDAIQTMYSHPQGAILLLEIEGKTVGCAGIHHYEEGIAELKRMYIQPNFRGKGRGRQLLQGAIDLAKELNYDAVQLDTMPSKMPAAVCLYKKMGFQEREMSGKTEEEVAYFILDLKPL